MKKENNHPSIIRSGIPKGTHVMTERGKETVENLRVTDVVLTEKKKFVPVKNIQRKSATGHYLVSAHGLDSFPVSPKGEMYVRDVDLKVEHGQVVPLIGWPYWVSVKKLDPSKHLLLSPYNPHSINPYRAISSRNHSLASAYTDQEDQIWLQIDKIEFTGETVDIFHIELEEDHGIAVEYLAVK